MKKKKMTRVEYQKKLRRKRMRLKPVPFAILILICSSIFIFSLYTLVTWQLDNNKIKNLHSEIDDISNGEFIKDKGDAFNPPDDKDSDYWYYIDLPFYNVDFDELLKKNKDTVAFIHMENNNINYPVVQSKDNSYYLTHAFDKSYNEAGWVFLDYRNNMDNLSKNTIIYAHGLVNNQMFGSLRKILKSSWYNNKNNHIIKLSTPTSNQLWQVFSTYTIEPEDYYITTSFSSDEEFQEFINTIKSRSVYDYGTKINTNDNILTLSSCYSDTKRMVLHAKLIKSD